jgi:hypothetical protein
MLPAEDPYSLALLYHVNSEPWLNLEAYDDPLNEMRFKRLPVSGQANRFSIRIRIRCCSAWSVDGAPVATSFKKRCLSPRSATFSLIATASAKS